ncbi:MAG: glycosyltransferase family 4 protein [Thermoplasmata archaeon]|nr:MAG: glycosyltransferase family 4 protein [Thermoplasmata archaeon]
MKICFISPSAGTITGGTETIVHQFARYLGKKHEVTIFTGRTRHKSTLKVLMDGPYEVVTVPFWLRFTPMNRLASKLVRRLTPYRTEAYSFYYNLLLRPKIKRRIKDMDVISTHYWVDSRLFSNLAFKLGVPSVFHILGGPYSKEYFNADKSTLYAAVSRNTQSLISNAHGFTIEDVVTPGIPSHILPDIENIKAKKEGEQLSLLFVGRLQRTKGVFELIEIFRRLVKQFPNLRLTIVGEGDILGELKEKINMYKLEDKIQLTGSLPYNDVFKYYRSATLLMFPTKSEVFPLVSIEAMACGLPVVASDIPGLRESTGENAVLLPPEDIDLWVDTLGRLLTDSEKRNQLSEKGIKWAKDFTWEKKAMEYEKVLKKAIKQFERKSTK